MKNHFFGGKPFIRNFTDYFLLLPPDRSALASRKKLFHCFEKGQFLYPGTLIHISRTLL